MQLYRVEVGKQHDLKPANLVGAIANEAGLDAKHIGRIDIFEDHSLVVLPEGMPKEILRHMKKVWVAGQTLRMSAVQDGSAGDRKAGKPARKKKDHARKKPGKAARRKPSRP